MQDYRTVTSGYHVIIVWEALETNFYGQSIRNGAGRELVEAHLPKFKLTYAVNI